MGVEERITYVMVCDGEDCGEVIDGIDGFESWFQCEAAAKSRGWEQRGLEWLCPECAEANP